MDGKIASNLSSSLPLHNSAEMKRVVEVGNSATPRWLIKQDHLRCLGNLIGFQEDVNEPCQNECLFHDCIINVQNSKWYVHRVFIANESLFFRFVVLVSLCFDKD